MFVINKIFRNQILQIKKGNSQIGHKMRKIQLNAYSLIWEEKMYDFGSVSHGKLKPAPVRNQGFFAWYL